MALINAGNTLFLGRGEVNLRPTSYTKDIQENEYWVDHWYCEFFNHDSIPLLYDKSVLSQDAIDRCKALTCMLILNNAHEAFHSVVRPIYDVCIKDLGIPASQIVLISESAIIDQEVEKVANEYNLPKINTKWMRIFEQMISSIVFSVPPLDTLQNKLYTKKFINLNRRWRIHRPTLVALLKINNLLDKGFVSLAKADDNKDWITFVDDIQHAFRHDSNFLNLFNQNADLIRSIPELKLDQGDMTINFAAPKYTLGETTDTFYLNSYFSIVSETNFFSEYGEGVFVSEKIFRPILKKHPFVLLARPKTLAAMRNLGYRTFSGIINEDYDNEENDFKRMLMIVHEIDRLSNLFGDELENFLNKAKEICDYNYYVLGNKKTFITEL